MRVLLGHEAEKFVGGKAPLSWQGKSKEMTENVCKKIGFPLMIKIVSSKIVHKTEKGGVRMACNWENVQKAVRHFDSLNVGSYEILLQEIVRGIELIAGIKNDATFGHVVMVGLGGVFAEVLKDVSFRVCPITVNEADTMLNELKGKDIFSARGKKANVAEIKNLLVHLSQLPTKRKSLQELDINPLIVNEKGAWVADARAVFR